MTSASGAITARRMDRAWADLPEDSRAVLSCERCGGSGSDPEYDLGPYYSYEVGPCIACGGYGFDRFDLDLRRMRILGLS